MCQRGLESQRSTSKPNDSNEIKFTIQEKGKILAGVETTLFIDANRNHFQFTTFKNGQKLMKNLNIEKSGRDYLHVLKRHEYYHNDFYVGTNVVKIIAAVTRALNQ